MRFSPRNRMGMEEGVYSPLQATIQDGAPGMTASVAAPCGAGSLRAPGAVLLVSCYELGHAPLGAAWPAAFLERAGFAPDVLDLAVTPLNPEPAARVRFVGIAVPMHTALRIGVRAAERIRQLNPHCHICLYGLYAVLNAESLLERVADSVIGGEFEGPLGELVRALDAGRPPDVPGVLLRGRKPGTDAGGRVWLAHGRLEFPVPSRDALQPPSTYVHLERGGVRTPAGSVEATRGCRHLCRHCPIPPVYGGRFVLVPADVVLEDARRQVRAGAGHLTFGDPDFLNGPGHVMPIVRALHQEHPRLTFDITTKVEHMLRHRDLFPELASFGCLFVVSAVESLSDAVLAHLDKGHTRADVGEALRIVRGAGMTLRPSLLPFTPWSTHEDYLDLLAWIDTEELRDAVDPVQLSIRLLVPPGSLLLSHEGMRPHLRGADPENFQVRWEHPDPAMDRLQAAVSRRVAAAIGGEEPEATFEGIRRCALEPGPHSAPALSEHLAKPGRVEVSPAPPRKRSPRLTEPWFC